MREVRKSAKARSVEKIFDRLTVLVLSHELLLSGACGPLNLEQRAFITGLVDRSKEVATLLREILER
jgi:hypothetical protein